MFAMPRTFAPSVHGLSAGVIIRVNSLRNDDTKVFAPRDSPAPMPALTAITATCTPIDTTFAPKSFASL